MDGWVSQSASAGCGHEQPLPMNMAPAAAVPAAGVRGEGPEVPPPEREPLNGLKGETIAGISSAHD